MPQMEKSLNRHQGDICLLNIYIHIHIDIDIQIHHILYKPKLKQYQGKQKLCMSSVQYIIIKAIPVQFFSVNIVISMSKRRGRW